MSGVRECREWKFRQTADVSEKQIVALVSDAGLSPLTVQVCLSRGLKDRQSIREFLNPKLEALMSPFKIRDMSSAIDRITRARGVEKIRVFGDYDVDGTTGSALLSWVFREHGFEADVRQPDRFKDGYGLNVKAVEDAASSGVRVLITVDCGITSFDAATRARELGMDLIVVDHHQLDAARGLPQAYAVINPQRPDCESGLKQLCGCGLAFYLAMALRAKGREAGWFEAGREPNLKQHLDLVVMATAADMVPLTGDNHILVRHGLEVLKSSKKPGVRALLEAAGVGSKDLSPGHLGFVIGPRINASGRMQSASLALELLTTTDEMRATELALELERLNQERATLQNQIWDEVRARVEQGLAAGKYRHGIVVADARWHEGVVGIVASRVTETFRKPAAVIALRDDFGKGSVRSYAGKDVLAALRECTSVLLGFGGHRHAAGLSVALDRVDQLAESFDDALSRIVEDADAKPLYIEGSCSLQDLDLKTLQELESLGPFGPGNPEPVFSVRARARSHRVLKGRHLKLDLSHAATIMEGIWFHAAERSEIMDGPALSEEGEWAGVPEVNRFRGVATPSFRVRDWRAILPALLLAIGLAAHAAPSPDPNAATVTEQALSVMPQEAQSLVKKFNQGQDAELAALQQHQRQELKDLKKYQAAEFKGWNAKERDARHRFFAEHKLGHERRAYLQDFKKRREDFVRAQADFLEQKTKEQSAAFAQVKGVQTDKKQKFLESLARGERPSPDLWPQKP